MHTASYGAGTVWRHILKTLRSVASPFLLKLPPPRSELCRNKMATEDGNITSLVYLPGR